MEKIKPYSIPCSSSSTYVLHICHQRLEKHLGNSWFVSSSIICRKCWLPNMQSAWEPVIVCVWSRGKNRNVYRWYLGVFSPLVLQDTVKRGNNCCLLKQGDSSTEKSKSWLRISVLSDLGTHAADAYCITSSCCHGFMMFILNDLWKTCSFSSRSLFLVHSKLPVVRDLDVQGLP